MLKVEISAVLPFGLKIQRDVSDYFNCNMCTNYILCFERYLHILDDAIFISFILVDYAVFKYTGCSKKTDPLDYFDDNFGKYGPILTIFSLLQQEIHDTQKLSYFSHLTFIVLPLYLAKRTMMLVSMRIFLDHAAKQISMYSSG